MPQQFYDEPSPFKAGLRSRCPRCGEGKLYSGLLQVAERCPHCDLSFADVDPGDGPAIFVILILGAIIVGAAFTVDSLFAPPYWLHLVLWIPTTLVGAIALLAPFKATLIALQYKTKAQEGRLSD